MDSGSKMGKGMATGIPPRDFNSVSVDAPCSIACCCCPRQRYQSRWAIGLTQ